MELTMNEIDQMDAEEYSTFLSEGDPICEELTVALLYICNIM